jgi:hypothetical protein
LFFFDITPMKQMNFIPIIAAVFVACLVSCADPPANAPLGPIASAPASRSVADHRVITFPEVHDETSGTAAEHSWTQAQFPHHEWSSRQLLEDRDGRTYHRVILKDDRGREVAIYFDITNWFDRLR